MHILVVGAGSIGQRHIKNLVELGVKVTCVEPNVEKWPIDITCCSSLSNGLNHNPDAAIVAVPTYRHAEVTEELIQGHIKQIFIEKPVTHNLQAALNLRDSIGIRAWKTRVVVGYSLRFHPALTIIKDLLPQIGTPLYARAEVGQYLPDWHPNEDYRNWYMAKEELGGGALLDLSHEIDYCRWLFGDIVEAHGFVAALNNSPLEIDSDDIAELQMDLGKNEETAVLASIHMDLLDRSYNRRLRILGTEGTISWDWNDYAVRLHHPYDTSDYYDYSPDRNIQFKEEMRAFINSVETGIVDERFCSLEDGIEVLKIVEELKEQNGRA